MGWKGEYTRAGFFGLDGRDVCHVGGGGSVVDGSFDLGSLTLAHIRYN